MQMPNLTNLIVSKGSYTKTVRLGSSQNNLIEQIKWIEFNTLIKEILSASSLESYNNSMNIKQSRLGIQENDPTKIIHYINEPYVRDRIKMYQNTPNLRAQKGTRPSSAKQKMKIQQQSKQKYKQKILHQELTKIQKLLYKKKASKKQIQQIQQLNYQNLLNNQIQKRKRFDQLIKKKNSLAEKQQLLQMVFDLLKQWKQKVNKSKLSGFLLANPNFSRKFFITEKQVNRDLDVYETEEKGFMSFNQFYEFIKSIELTNPLINPTLRTKMKQSKPILEIQKKEISQKKNFDKSPLEKRQQKALQKYIKSLFSYLDKNKESVISKQILVTSLNRAFLLKKQVKISKETGEVTFIFENDKLCLIRQSTIQSFLKFIQSVHPSKNKKSFYKELQSKFVGIEELLKILRSFQKERNIRTNKEDKMEQQRQNNQINQKQAQINKSETYQQQNDSHINQILPQQQSQLQKNSQQKIAYPWQNQPSYLVNQNHQTQNHLSQLRNLDKYYRELRNQHANQIQWGNIKNEPQMQKYRQKQILADFRTLQRKIKQMQYHQV